MSHFARVEMWVCIYKVNIIIISHGLLFLTLETPQEKKEKKEKKTTTSSNGSRLPHVDSSTPPSTHPSTHPSISHATSSHAPMHSSHSLSTITGKPIAHGGGATGGGGSEHAPPLDLSDSGSNLTISTIASESSRRRMATYVFNAISTQQISAP